VRIKVDIGDGVVDRCVYPAFGTSATNSNKKSYESAVGLTETKDSYIFLPSPLHLKQSLRE